ncbi:MAG: hypothetical protein ACRDRU_12650 [Pseudonocardiaceae bacterium]
MTEIMCSPPTSGRVIVLIAIVIARIAILFAFVDLMQYSLAVAVTLAATAMLSEEALRRLTLWQYPGMA